MALRQNKFYNILPQNDSSSEVFFQSALGTERTKEAAIWQRLGIIFTHKTLMWNGQIIFVIIF